jgi:hypothetical protein
MRALTTAVVTSLCVAPLGCSRQEQPPPPSPSAAEAHAGIDSLNARLARAYRDHDPQAYAALFTDTAVFEWPAFNTVRGAAQLLRAIAPSPAAPRSSPTRRSSSGRRSTRCAA